jgi:hypothetical protein
MSEFDPASLLSDAEKAAIANDRVQAAARDAYGHVLNREKALAADPECGYLGSRCSYQIYW